MASVLEYPKGKNQLNFILTRFKHYISLIFIILDLIKDSARPSYWVPDHEAPNCSLCSRMFGTAEQLLSGIASGSPIPSSSGIQPSSIETNIKTEIRQSPAKHSPHSPVRDRKRHHCRSCGQAVCDECSQNRRPVPERGWTTDVRVCDACNKKYKND